MIKFDRLRPFPVIHRLSAIISAVFWGVRVCSSLSDFDAVRASSFLLCECLPTPPRLDRTHKPNNEPPRISPHRLKAAGAIRIKFVFQIVKDQLSSSGVRFKNPGNSSHCQEARSTNVVHLREMTTTLISRELHDFLHRQNNDIKL